MFILKRHNSYFKTQTGKIYPASKSTLEFVDAAVESQYVSYLAFKSFPLFRLVSFIVPIWSIVIVGFRYLAKSWSIWWCYLLPVPTVFIGPLSVWLVSYLLRQRRNRR